MKVEKSEIVDTPQLFFFREKKTEAIMSMPTTTISNEQNLIANREEMKGGEQAQSVQGKSKCSLTLKMLATR